MGRISAVVLAVLLTASGSLVACTPRQFSRPWHIGDGASTQAATTATAVQQGIRALAVQAPTSGTPTPYVGQPGDTVTVTGSISFVFADPVPDPVTGSRQPGIAIYYLTPDEPRLPMFRLIYDTPLPVLSQAFSAGLQRSPFRVRVTGRLLDPLPSPRQGGTVRLQIASITAV